MVAFVMVINICCFSVILLKKWVILCKNFIIVKESDRYNYVQLSLVGYGGDRYQSLGNIKK
jgi:hypothetical protein